MSEETVPSTLDELMAAYGGKESDTFTFALDDGRLFCARTIHDSSAIMEIEKKVKHVQKVIEKKRVPSEWLPFLPIDAGVLRMCVYCEELLLEPKLSLLDALKLAKQCGMLIPTLGAHLLEGMAGIVTEAEVEEIDDLKNDWSETDSTEPS